MTVTSLPKIDENSEISRLAERKFSVLLPGTWTSSSPKQGDDYGIDVTLSITDGPHPTGRLAHVQLKGTRATGANAQTLRVKESTLSYLRSHADVATLVRVQVDEDRYWIVHVYDHRTYNAPDSEGYIRIALDTEDEVAPTAVAERIDRQSYRKYIQSAPNAPFAIRVTPPSLAMVLNMQFAERFPKALSFVASTTAPDATHQMMLDIPGDCENAVTIRDLASPNSAAFAQNTPGHFLVGLADFLARMGAGHLAAGIMTGSPELITQDAMDTLSRDVQQQVLRDACVRFSTDNEVTSFILSSIATGAHWAGEWAINLVMSGRYIAPMNDIDAIFKCLPPSRSLSLQLLRTKLYNRCGHI